MKPKTATQRLAFKIAEEVVSLFDKHVYPDAEEVYQYVYNLLPDDDAFRQAIEEQEEFEREPTYGRARCGLILGKLRKVLHAQEGYPIGKLIELAAQRCERAVELEEAIAMLNTTRTKP